MDSFHFVLMQAMQAFQTEMTLFGFTFSFYNVFWWIIITSAFIWIVFHIILG